MILSASVCVSHSGGGCPKSGGRLSPFACWTLKTVYCESFNGKLREECLNGEIFYSLKEARIVIEQWRQQYKRVRPHAALGYRPPAPGPIPHLGTRFQGLK